MSRFPLGIIALIVIAVLVYFGLAHRVLDRMRLTDKAALGILAAMIVGSFIDIPISMGRVNASINVGGGLVPIGLAIYVLTRAGSAKEWIRALLATGITGIIIYYLGSVLMEGDPGKRSYNIIDPIWVYPIVGGLVAYIAGRSRRSAFIAATLGVMLLDVINWIYLASTGTPGRVSIGGAGAFDSIILAGLVAVLLAELIGETRERLQGGPATEGRPPELLEALKNDAYANKKEDIESEDIKPKRREAGEKDE